MRKKDFLTKTDLVTEATFEHNFEAIKAAKYFVDPNTLHVLKNPMQLNFYHDQKQQELISNQVKLYSAHAIGLGKMLQRTNMKLMFRRFIKPDDNSASTQKHS